MGIETKIAWSDMTWNAFYGCSKVSPGCTNCYAVGEVSRLARRLQTRNPEKADFFRDLVNAKGTNWSGKVELNKDRVGAPLAVRTPKKIFTNSLSDMFHESLPAPSIAALFAVMAATPHHTYQVLTKRPRSAARFFAWVQSGLSGGMSLKELLAEAAFWRTSVETYGRIQKIFSDPKLTLSWPLNNVWLGVTMEDQPAVRERLPLLLQLPAAVRWVSAEPLLGPLDFQGRLARAPAVVGPCLCPQRRDPWTRCEACEKDPVRYRQLTTGVDWVVVGGESGEGRRPFDMAWARDILAQCRAAETAFFFKQQAGAKAGERPYIIDETGQHLTIQEFPQVTG